LILTAPIGGGHIAAAQALAERIAPGSVTRPTIRPLLTESWPFKSLPMNYELATTRAAFLWSAYYNARQVKRFRSLNGKIVHHLMKSSIASLEMNNFDFVIVTHSMYCHSLRQLAEHGLPVIVAVTDLYGGPLEWFEPGANLYIVQSPEFLNAATRCGLSKESILLRRLPTRTRVRSHHFRWTVHRKLQVLVVGGVEGAGPLEAVVDGVRRSSLPIQVTLICGRNVRLFERLNKTAAPDVDVRAFLPDLGKRVDEYDIVITKPGAGTLMELFATSTPFLLVPGIPGIEKENLRTISRSGYIPVIDDRKSAQNAIERLVDRDLSLTQEGHHWLNELSRLKRNLPDELDGRVEVTGDRGQGD
jgi:UDP-N-acetylglucosamine:LPS N-acetylglucosamine transferase